MPSFNLNYWLLVLLCCLATAGCSSTRSSRFDEFEKVKIDKMTGNDVSGGMFQKTLLCLNVLRETRSVTLVTNLEISYITNFTVTSVTNLTVSKTSNSQVATATNPVYTASQSTGEFSTNNRSASGQPLAAAGGSTLSTNRSESVATGLNQNVVSDFNQIISVHNLQSALTTNDLNITRAVQLTSTLETNAVVTTMTNALPVSITNIQILSTNFPVYDYYLYTEIIPPPDFTIQSGESLVILTDGTRHGLISTNATPGFVARKGMITTFYKASPELLVELANANEVKIRVRGNNTSMERRMNSASQNRIRTFLISSMGSSNDVKAQPMAQRN